MEIKARTEILPFCEQSEVQKQHPDFLFQRLACQIHLQDPFCYSKEHFNAKAQELYYLYDSLTAIDCDFLQVEIYYYLKEKLDRKEKHYPSFLLKIIDKIGQFTKICNPGVSRNTRFHIVTLIYKIIARHFSHRGQLKAHEMMKSLMQLARISFSKDNSSTLIPTAEKTLQMVAGYLLSLFQKGQFQKIHLDQLTPFSEIDMSDWQELLWNMELQVKNSIKKCPKARLRLQLIQDVTEELLLCEKDLSLIPLMLKTKSKLQELKSVTSHIDRPEFLLKLSYASALLIKEKKALDEEDILNQALQKVIKESLRFSCNLDQICQRAHAKYLRCLQLPPQEIQSVKKIARHIRLYMTKQGLNLAKDHVKTFVIETWRSLQDHYPTLSQTAMVDELIASYENALKLPKIPLLTLETRLFALLWNYLQAHPLHNTLRTITLEAVNSASVFDQEAIAQVG